MCPPRTGGDPDGGALSRLIEGNPRDEAAPHPDLQEVYCGITHRRSSRSTSDAMTLVQSVRQGYGTKTPREKQLKDVTILDVFENAASVKVVASDWVDYLHIAKSNGRWVIVNVLWEMNPTKKQPPSE